MAGTRQSAEHTLATPSLPPSAPGISGTGGLSAAAGPVAAAGSVFALWWISDQVGHIGPFDRAALGWLVVVPLWALVPLAVAYGWRRLPPGATMAAALVTAIVISVASSVLFWAAVAFPDCQFGALQTPAGWIVPSVIVGIVIGGGSAVAGLATTAVLRAGAWWQAALVGAGSAMLVVFLGLAAATPFITMAGCQRPL